MTIKPKEYKRSKDEASAHFKYVCLSKIYERDKVGEYPKTFATLRDLKKEKNKSYEQLRKFVSDKMSTTEASVKQFTEYLNDIHVWALANDGFYLEKPEDLMYVLELN